MTITILIYLQALAVTVIYTLVCVPLFLPAMLWSVCLAPEKRPFIARFFVLWYGRAILSFGWRPYVKIRCGSRPGKHGSAGIYVFNHRSASDPFLVAAVVSRGPAQIANSWPMRLPFLGFFARMAEYVDVRSTPADEVERRVKKLLAEGVPVMAFPEGTRSGGRFMNQFHGLVFRIAKETGAPLIPVAVAGNEEIPDRKFRMKCGTILIRRLPQIPPETVRKMSPFLLKNHVRELLLAETSKMDSELDAEREGH